MTTIAILTKYPTPGRSKSRMIPSLGPQGAADLSQEMLLHTIEKLCKFQSLYNHNNSNSSNNIKLCVYFDPCISKEDELEYNNDANKDICLAMKNLIKNNNVQVHCIPLQLRNKGSNLGFILSYILSQHISQNNVIFIGSDCPQIPLLEFEKAESVIVDGNVYICPASDGGYVLLGLPQDNNYENTKNGNSISSDMNTDVCLTTVHAYFDGVAWSTEHCYNTQVSAIESYYQSQQRWGGERECRACMGGDSDEMICKMKIIHGITKYVDIDDKDDLKHYYQYKKNEEDQTRIDKKYAYKF